MSADSFLFLCKYEPFDRGSRLSMSSFPREYDTESRVNHVYLWLMTTATSLKVLGTRAVGSVMLMTPQSKRAFGHLGLATDLRR
jgi:hypothetical protein